MNFFKIKHACFLFFLLSSCNKSDLNLNKDVAEEIRVVSFSPALTDFVLSLGGESYLVGRTPWCDVNADIPIIGDLFNVELEKLVHLDPTHILVQKEELKGSFLDPFSKLKSDILTLPIQSIEDSAVACLKIGEIFSFDMQSKKRASLLADRIRGTVAKTYFLGAEHFGNGLIVSSSSSSSSDVLSWGGKTYLGEMLHARGFDLIHNDDAWRTINLEYIFKLNPGWILVVGDQKKIFESFQLMKLEASKSGRILEIAHRGIDRPSSSLPEISQKLDLILGTLFSD